MPHLRRPPRPLRHQKSTISGPEAILCNLKYVLSRRRYRREAAKYQTQQIRRSTSYINESMVRPETKGSTSTDVQDPRLDFRSLTSASGPRDGLLGPVLGTVPASQHTTNPNFSGSASIRFDDNLKFLNGEIPVCKK